jgi:hypothetical protein
MHGETMKFINTLYIFCSHPYNSRNILYMRESTADDGTTLPVLIAVAI